MALRIPFANDAKQYDFGYLRHLAETILNSEGVANYGTDLVVTPAATGLRVDIAAGAAWVKGDSGTPAMGISQGLFSVVNDAAVANAVTLPAADPTNPRIDQIVLRVRDSSDLGSGADDAIFDYVQGTATGGATLLNRTGAAALGNDRLLLADVLVPAAATNLTAANVRDRRIPANGKASRPIATSETTTSTSYVDLATPDLIDVYVPPGAFVNLWYRANWKSTVGDNSKAALYVIDRQTGTDALVTRDAQTAPSSWEPLSSAPLGRTDFFTALTTANSTNGLQATSQGAGGVTADNFFGQSGSDNLPWILTGLTGGRVYGFSWRFKNQAAATLTVKDRLSSVYVHGHGRSQ